MSTATPKPIIHVFKEYNIGKFKTTKHYKLETVKNGTNQLTDIINISKDRNCAQSMPDYWLQIREGKKWKIPRLTGLFKTRYSYIYSGDIKINGVKTHTLLFKFSNNADTLVIKYFENYYTKDINTIQHFIK
jgi:hypothetical protein